MEPTYHSGGFNFCWRGAYWFRDPARGDVAIFTYAEHRAYLLKRILAFEGETVEFRSGVCYIDGRAVVEPYSIQNPEWNLPPCRVRPGFVFVMGDNRTMPPGEHKGGEISLKKLAGRPLW